MTKNKKFNQPTYFNTNMYIIIISQKFSKQSYINFTRNYKR